MFQGLQNQLCVDALCDSDSVCFPIREYDNVNISKRSSPNCVTKNDFVTCSKDVIEKCPGVQCTNQLSVQVLCDSDEPICFPNTENDNVVVSKASKPGNKRVYDKEHCCVYCNVMYAKISRHLEQKHSNETNVAFALSLPKNSKERK